MSNEKPLVSPDGNGEVISFYVGKNITNEVVNVSPQDNDTVYVSQEIRHRHAHMSEHILHSRADWEAIGLRMG